MVRRLGIVTMLATGTLALAGCGGGSDSGAAGGDDGGDTTAEDGGTPTETKFEGIDLALSVKEVMELNFEGDLDVRGFVVEANGQTLLCTTAQGDPPTCGKPSLVLVGYEGEVPSPEETFVTGEVSGNRIIIR